MDVPSVSRPRRRGGRQPLWGFCWIWATDGSVSWHQAFSQGRKYFSQTPHHHFLVAQQPDKTHWSWPGGFCICQIAYGDSQCGRIPKWMDVSDCRFMNYHWRAIFHFVSGMFNDWPMLTAWWVLFWQWWWCPHQNKRPHSDLLTRNLRESAISTWFWSGVGPINSLETYCFRSL